MKLGRNDPCHCGSGRKYKHCHYNDDRAAEAQVLKEAAEEATQDAPESAAAEEATPQDTARAAAERAAATGRRDHSGSRFMRNSASGSGAKAGGKGPGTTPRATRGAQRGS